MKTYYIYTLTNPINGQIFYVGCSTNTTSRMKSHRMYNPKTNKKRKAKCKKDHYILDNAIVPVFNIVDEVIGTKEDGWLLEAFWIKKLVGNGEPITNVVNNECMKITDRKVTVNIFPRSSMIEFLGISYAKEIAIRAIEKEYLKKAM